VQSSKHTGREAVSDTLEILTKIQSKLNETLVALSEQSLRLTKIEQKLLPDDIKESVEIQNAKQPKRRKKEACKSPSSVWFEWHKQDVDAAFSNKATIQ
jgi:hypothetical protein